MPYHPLIILAQLIPTGVSFSTPTVSFFNSDADRSVWDFSASGLDVNSSSPSLQIPRLWARSQALGYLAEARDNGIFAHVTTDNVARDMWSMVQAYNQTKLQYYGLSCVGSFPLIPSYTLGIDMELLLEQRSRRSSRYIACYGIRIETNRICRTKLDVWFLTVRFSSTNYSLLIAGRRREPSSLLLW